MFNHILYWFVTLPRLVKGGFLSVVGVFFACSCLVAVALPGTSERLSQYATTTAIAERERLTQATSMLIKNDTGVTSVAIALDSTTIAPTLIPTIVLNTATIAPTLTPTSEPTLAPQPTVVERVVATGESFENDTWRFNITEVKRTNMLENNDPKGQWMLIYGTAENRTADAQWLHIDDFLLTTSALRGEIEMDRTATWTAADNDPVVDHTVARFGGLQVDPGASYPLLMVFDVSLSATDLTLWLPKVDYRVSLGAANAIAEVPTVVPTQVPTLVPTIEPTVDSYSAERQYISTIAPAVENLGKGLEVIGGLSQSPEFFNKRWRTQYAAAAAIVIVSNEEVQKTDPPTSMQELHHHMVQATKTCSTAVQMVVKGIDDLDADQIQAAAQTMNSCSEKSIVATTKLKEWRNAHPDFQ